MAVWFAGRARDGGIDEIPLPTVAGRLWLCGKHHIAPDPDAALAAVGATTVLCLTERHELTDRYASYVAWLERNAPDRASWHPVPDLSAPQVDDARRLLIELNGRLDAGEGVVAHCGAGIGRAGTIAIALLMHLGSPLDDASATVAAHRPMAGPEAGAQADLLALLAGG